MLSIWSACRRLLQPIVITECYVMTKHTSRDSVWDHALRLAVDKERFNVQSMRDIITETMSDRTVRDTLNTMVDRGWLSKESPHSNEWVPGPRISDEKVH